MSFSRLLPLVRNSCFQESKLPGPKKIIIENNEQVRTLVNASLQHLLVESTSHSSQQTRGVATDKVWDRERNRRNEKNDDHEEEASGPFKRLQIKPQGEEKRPYRELVDTTPPPRANQMDPEQDWTNVWPTAASFRHSATPLPVRMGVSRNMGENKGVPMHKSVNVELLKIPNFLHLTPAHIEKHVDAIKQFCTPWPEGLETEADFEKHFPVEVTTRDFVYNWSIRDERSKINEVRVKLSSLHLDYHARDKIVRLAEGRRETAPDLEEEELKKTQIGLSGDTPRNLYSEARRAADPVSWLNVQKPDGTWRRRHKHGWHNRARDWLHPEVKALQENLPAKIPIADYDYDNDMLMIHTEQCPTRKQNYDYAIFVLRALYGEACKEEDWEAEKEVEDHEKFMLMEDQERKALAVRLYRASHNSEESEEDIVCKPEVMAYQNALEALVNSNENLDNMAAYKAAVKRLLAMKD